MVLGQQLGPTVGLVGGPWAAALRGPSRGRHPSGPSLLPRTTPLALQVPFLGPVPAHVKHTDVQCVSTAGLFRRPGRGLRLQVEQTRAGAAWTQG